MVATQHVRGSVGQPLPAATKPKQAALPGGAKPQAVPAISRGRKKRAQRVVVYGPGGVGKTELCSLLGLAAIEPLFLDLDGGSYELEVARVEKKDLETFDALRTALQNRKLLEPFGAVVIDSATRAEELAVAWTIENVKTDKGKSVESIEGYGWGKGYMRVYETFLRLLGDLDEVVRHGKHVICTAHECMADVPNPGGEDWLRYEPRLQSPPKGKASIRHRVKEWCDHLLFVGFDVHVAKDGKAVGAGTRTIYPTEQPTHWAKSRRLEEPIPCERGDAALWQRLFPAK